MPCYADIDIYPKIPSEKKKVSLSLIVEESRA